MNTMRAKRRVGLDGIALGVGLVGVLAVGALGAARETPGPAPVRSAVAGRVDIAAELAAVSWAAGGAMRSRAAPSGDAWASTQQYPGRPY